MWGLDTRNSPYEPWNSGYSGYYNFKQLDESIEPQYTAQTVPWRFIRYAEVLLNYAEACIELGQDVEARDYINMVRDRAGVPPVTESGAALLARYRNERRIELSYEEHRFFDVRRWVIGNLAYQPATGVKIVYQLLPDNTTATVPTITPFVFENRAWLNKAYFMPILRDEMNKNNKLIQNPDY